MKKTFFIIFTLFLFIKTNAQDWDFGIGIGPNISTLSTIGFDRATQPKGIGVMIYGYGNYSLNDKFSIDGKLGFDNRNINYLPDGGEYLVAVNYFTFNPMLKMDLGSEPFKGAFLKAGVRVSQLLSAKEKETDLSINEDYKGTNFGVGFSFGVDFLEHFGIELLFDFALIDELENSNSDIKINSASLLFYINLNSLIN